MILNDLKVLCSLNNCIIISKMAWTVCDSVGNFGKKYPCAWWLLLLKTDPLQFHLFYCYKVSPIKGEVSKFSLESSEASLGLSQTCLLNVTTAANE